MIEAHISQEAASNFRKPITIPDETSETLTKLYQGDKQKAFNKWATYRARQLVNHAFTGNLGEGGRTVASVRNLFFDPETNKLDHRVLGFMDILTTQLRQGEKRVALAEKALEDFQEQIPSILEQASTLKIQFLPENSYTSNARDAKIETVKKAPDPDPDSFNVYLTLKDDFLSLRVKYSPREGGTGNYKAIEFITIDPQPQIKQRKITANILRDLERGQELINLLIQKRNESLT